MCLRHSVLEVLIMTGYIDAQFAGNGRRNHLGRRQVNSQTTNESRPAHPGRTAGK